LPPRAGARCSRRGSAFALALFLSATCHAADRVALCESCHGPGGNSATPLTPSIAGQPVTFLEHQLVFFREGLRNAPVMAPIMKGVGDDEVASLARHFSRQDVKVPGAAAQDPGVAARGKEIAGKRHCGQCHLPTYRGRDQVPRLAGQREDYLVDTMKAYRDGKRTGADTTMIEVLDGLSDDDIKSLAAYLVSLPP
jgi:cytochrome c553